MLVDKAFELSPLQLTDCSPACLASLGSGSLCRGGGNCHQERFAVCVGRVDVESTVPPCRATPCQTALVACFVGVTAGDVSSGMPAMRKLASDCYNN